MQKSPFDKDFLRENSFLLIILAILTPFVYIAHTAELLAHTFHWDETIIRLILASLFFLLVVIIVYGLLINKKILLLNFKNEQGEDEYKINKKKRNIFYLVSLFIFVPYILIYSSVYCHKTENPCIGGQTPKQIYSVVKDSVDQNLIYIITQSSNYTNEVINEKVSDYKKSVIEEQISSLGQSEKCKKYLMDSIKPFALKDSSSIFKISRMINLSKSLNSLPEIMNTGFDYQVSQIMSYYNIDPSATLLTYRSRDIKNPQNFPMYHQAANFKYGLKTVFMNSEKIEIIKMIPNRPNTDIDTIFLLYK